MENVKHLRKSIFHLLLVALLTMGWQVGFAQAGFIDLTFNAIQLDSTNHNFWVNTESKFGYIQASALQPDGKIILGGDFETYNGKPVKSLVRFNTDGSLDETFSLADAIDVRALALQSDGKIIVGAILLNLPDNPATGYCGCMPTARLMKPLTQAAAPVFNRVPVFLTAAFCGIYCHAKMTCILPEVF